MLLSVLNSFTANASTRFAQVTDLHFGLPESNARIDKVIEDLNGRNIDFICITGDIIEAKQNLGEIYKSLAKKLSQLKAPYFIIPGNHDDIEHFRLAFPAPKEYSHTHQGDHFSVLYKNQLFIFLNSTRKNFSSGGLENTTLDWLETTIQEYSNYPIYLLMHHPPVDFDDLPQGSSPMHQKMQVYVHKNEFQGIQRLKAILQRHGQVIHAIFTGHAHFGCTFALKGGVKLIICPSVAPTKQFFLDEQHNLKKIGISVNSAPGYMIHSLSANGLKKTQTVFLESTQTGQRITTRRQLGSR